MDNEIQPYGQISTSDLSLWFVYSITTKNGNELDFILVSFYYEWLNMPVARLQDPIAVSWGDELLRLEDNSFNKIDKYSGYYFDLTQNLITITDAIQSEEDGYANASPAGVSWYADLKGNIGLTVTELYGYGSFHLVPAHGTTVYTGTYTTLYAHYVHPTFSLGASIDIPRVGSFSVSGGGAYDERGTQLTFEIKKRTI